MVSRSSYRWSTCGAEAPDRRRCVIAAMGVRSSWRALRRPVGPFHDGMAVTGAEAATDVPAAAESCAPKGRARFAVVPSAGGAGIVLRVVMSERAPSIAVAVPGDRAKARKRHVVGVDQEMLIGRAVQ
jgi:hypothetical protein